MYWVAHTFQPTFCGRQKSLGYWITKNNKNCFLLLSGIRESHKTKQALTPQVCRQPQNKETLFPRLFLVGSLFVLRHKEANIGQILPLLCVSPTPSSGSWTGAERRQLRGDLWVIFGCQLIHWKEENKLEIYIQGSDKKTCLKSRLSFFIIFHVHGIVLCLIS